MMLMLMTERLTCVDRGRCGLWMFKSESSPVDRTCLLTYWLFWEDNVSIRTLNVPEDGNCWTVIETEDNQYRLPTSKRNPLYIHYSYLEF